MIINCQRRPIVQSLFYACRRNQLLRPGVPMTDEQKQRDEREREQRRRRLEEEKPQTWKHPEDGTELSEQDQEIPLKP